MSNPRAGTGNSLGLAVGATNLAGTSDRHRPVIRPAAVTLDRGLVMTGFVDRVGDPVPMVAQDGSQHRPELLLVEALDGLARSTANGGPVSEVAVTVPAHWRPPVVETLRAALRTKPGLSRSPVVSDATAALTALRSDPGLPSSGVIVLCDFGGSGTSITLVDAAAKDAPIGETVRVPDFSGDQIDQAILTKVVAGIFEAADADPSGTAVVGSLARLRDECRRAKERLSDETATGIPVDLPGLETTVRLTRMELDDLVDGQLAEFVAVLFDVLDRHRVPLASVSAVATVGGGARIPLITQRLSEHLRTRVVTTPFPQLTAAAGVALIAQRSQNVESATALAPAAPATGTVPAAAVGVGGPPAAVGALAWSEVDDDPADAVRDETRYRNPYLAEPNPYAAEPGDSRPELEFTREEWEDGPSRSRRGQVVLAGVAAAAVLVGAVVFGLTAISRGSSPEPAGTSSSIAPAPASAPVSQASAPAADAPAQAPAPQQAAVVSAPQPQVVTQQPAAVDSAPQQAAAPAPEAPAPAPAPAPEAPAPAPAPAPEIPAPAPAPATAPATENPAPAPWTPPWNPPWRQQPGDTGTGGSGSSTGSGTGTGSGGTGTGTGSGGTGGSTGTGGGGSSTGGATGTGEGGGAKTPPGPGLLAPILQPILTPQP